MALVPSSGSTRFLVCPERLDSRSFFASVYGPPFYPSLYGEDAVDEDVASLIFSHYFSLPAPPVNEMPLSTLKASPYFTEPICFRLLFSALASGFLAAFINVPSLAIAYWALTLVRLLVLLVVYLLLVDVEFFALLIFGN